MSPPTVVNQEVPEEHPRRCERDGGTSPSPQICRTSPWSKILHWVSYLLALGFYLLTVLYAWHPKYFSRFESVGGSPAEALRLLAIFSGIASPLIALCVAQALDDLRRLLFSRPCGLNFMDFLALQQGIGPGGLWDIIRLWGLPRLSAKAWAIGNAVSILVVPILSILILAKVDTSLRFYQKHGVPASRGYGMGTFNASLAQLLNPVMDLTFSTRFKDFLSDSDRVRDTTSKSDRKQCAARNSSTCRTSYLVPGGMENFAAALLNGTGFSNSTAIQPVLALDQRSYHFEFEDNHTRPHYNTSSECIEHGFSIGAFQLCLKNTRAFEIQAYITVCPKDLAANTACLSNHSWHLQKGWSTVMATHARFATIAYNGLNGTILSHQYTNDSSIPIDIGAGELLDAFNTALGPVDVNSSFGALLKLLNISTNTPILPLTVWQYFDSLTEDNPRTNRLAAIGLQSFLALALYHCQGKNFIELRRLLGDGASGESLPKTLGQQIIAEFPAVEPDTDIVPGILRYDLNVDRSILIPYIVLAGTTLALCLAMQIVAFWNGLGCSGSGFPPLDVLSECEAQDLADGKPVLPQRFANLYGKGARDQLVEAAKMRIVRSPLLCGAASTNDNAVNPPLSGMEITQWDKDATEQQGVAGGEAKQDTANEATGQHSAEQPGTGQHRLANEPGQSAANETIGQHNAEEGQKNKQAFSSSECHGKKEDPRTSTSQPSSTERASREE